MRAKNQMEKDGDGTCTLVSKSFEAIECSRVDEDEEASYNIARENMILSSRSE